MLLKLCNDFDGSGSKLASDLYIYDLYSCRLNHDFPLGQGIPA